MVTNGITFTKEDIDLVEKFIDIKNRGYYCSGEELTKVYNRILHKNVNVTNCGTCLRGRVSELEAALKYFKEMCKKQEEAEKASEQRKEEKVDNVTPEENKANSEAENKSTEKKRVGRPKKS